MITYTFTDSACASATLTKEGDKEVIYALDSPAHKYTWTWSATEDGCIDEMDYLITFTPAVASSFTPSSGPYANEITIN